MIGLVLHILIDENDIQVLRVIKMLGRGRVRDRFRSRFRFRFRFSFQVSKFFKLFQILTLSQSSQDVTVLNVS